MTNTELKSLLFQKCVCDDAIAWIGDRDPQTAWKECKKGDWMLWIISNFKTTATDQQLRLIAVKCARQVEHLMTDQRSINALDVAERYANGEATKDELRKAEKAAEGAWAVAAVAAREAAWVAREAVREKAGVAEAAAWAAKAEKAVEEAWEKQSDIIRSIIPTIQIIQ